MQFTTKYSTMFLLLYISFLFRRIPFSDKDIIATQFVVISNMVQNDCICLVIKFAKLLVLSPVFFLSAFG
jgi:hypothetical protein